MWVGYVEGVGAYGEAICREWVERGAADTVAGSIGADLAAAGLPPVPRPQQELARAAALPPWLGDERLHASHRAALVRTRSSPLRPEVDPRLPYFWPDEPG